MNVARGTADRGAPPPASPGTGSLSAEGARQVSRERGGPLSGRRAGVPIAVGALLLALIVVAAATGSTAVVVAAGVLLAILAVLLLVRGRGASRAPARDLAVQPDAGELSPHDLPPDHPGRAAAQDQAADAEL